MKPPRGSSDCWASGFCGSARHTTNRSVAATNRGRHRHASRLHLIASTIPSGDTAAPSLTAGPVFVVLRVKRAMPPPYHFHVSRVQFARTSIRPARDNQRRLISNISRYRVSSNARRNTTEELLDVEAQRPSIAPSRAARPRRAPDARTAQDDSRMSRRKTTSDYRYRLTTV